MNRKGFAAIILIIAVVMVAAVVGYYFLVFRKVPVLQAPVADVSSWTIYNNYFYGFEIQYPPDWQFLIRGGSGDPTSRIDGFELQPHLSGALVATSSGNSNLPLLAMMPRYALESFVGDSGSTSTPKFLADLYVSSTNAKFEKEFPISLGAFPGTHDLKIGAYDGYELYGVDHGSVNPKTELIFVKYGTTGMSFEFPVAGTPADNYNFSPAENNVIARQIVNTLIFTK